MNGVMSMRISALNNDYFEERRRVLQRKEANDAYKKNAIYTQAKKNPMLKILEDLLSGKTEKELFEKNLPSLNDESEKHNPLTVEVGDDNLSLIESPPLEMTSEMLQQSSMEAVSDEENVNRISQEQFDFFNPEMHAPATDRNTIINYPFNGSFERVVIEKTYTQAASSYGYHMQMAQNGFKLEQSIFSYSA